MTVRQITIHRSCVVTLLLSVILCGTGTVFAQAVRTKLGPSTTNLVPQALHIAQTPHSTAATQAVIQVKREALVEGEVAPGANDVLGQIKSQAAPEVGMTKTTGANDLSEQIRGLEATGQYVERAIRIPEGNNGAAKFVRFLIPIFRETGGKPMFDRERHYHRPEKVRTGGDDLPAVEAPIPAP